jgi:hypothetical protein
MNEKNSGRSGPPQPPTRVEAARRHASKWRFPVGGLVMSIIVFSYFTHSRYWITEPLGAVKEPSTPHNVDDPMNPWKSVSFNPLPSYHTIRSNKDLVLYM